jgi:multidrug efflux system membrane fusion protein
MAVSPTSFAKRPRILLVGATLLARVGVISYMHFGAPASRSVASASAPQITVAPTLSRLVPDQQVFTGRLPAIDTIAIRPRVNGYLEAVLFQEGARVQIRDAAAFL